MFDPKDRNAWDSPARPDDAANVLARAYGDLAGEEALFRAFLAERDLRRDLARFWLDVYGRLSPVQNLSPPSFPPLNSAASFLHAGCVSGPPWHVEKRAAPAKDFFVCPIAYRLFEDDGHKRDKQDERNELVLPGREACNPGAL